MVALYGLQDPLKSGVKEAIRICNEAGITVRMVTGDNLDTATAIAIEANILGSDFYST
jgi:P-type E1-E2 ATPase